MAMATPMSARAPGVYRDERGFTPPEPFGTGIPAFLGIAAPRDTQAGREPRRLTRWPQFAEEFASTPSDGYLAASVRSFFANGGRECHVVPLEAEVGFEDALTRGLGAIETNEDVDLVCVPDIARAWGVGLDPAQVWVERMQRHVLRHCDAIGDRFALLDAAPGATHEGVVSQRAALQGTNGALYFPWVRVASQQREGQTAPRSGFVPPCGSVAGVIARSDREAGVHKAPANERLNDALALAVRLDAEQAGALNAAGVNCLRAFPGRGIRVFGARTVADVGAWRFVNVRRTVLGVKRWIERRLASVTFEPNDRPLWNRIEREIGFYLDELYRAGALRGATPDEAYRVRCDEALNPDSVRDAGIVVCEVALAPAEPAEFLIIRLVHGPEGTRMEEAR